MLVFVTPSRLNRKPRTHLRRVVGEMERLAVEFRSRFSHVAVEAQISTCHPRSGVEGIMPVGLNFRE